MVPSGDRPFSSRQQRLDAGRRRASVSTTATAVGAGEQTPATPASAGTGTAGLATGGPHQPLPPHFIDDAAGRVAWLAMTAPVVIVVSQLLHRYTQPVLAGIVNDPVNRLATLASVLCSIGIVAAHRYRVVTNRTILLLGMALELVVAVNISMLETTLPITGAHPVAGISALGCWIVIAGTVIPNRPVWTLTTALAAATTWPVAYALNAVRLDFAPAPWGSLVVWPFFNYMLAAIAYLFGRHAYGMAVAAHEAEALGSYRLVSRIGEGGMGEVWKASHQMLARAAAIKLVRPQVARGSGYQADVLVRRFKREANVIALLQSPHTVYLYDFGVSADGRFYYVMELLDGISLQALVTRFGPQPASRVVSILSQACCSLEEAHRQGLVHRDLKPSNIMLCKVALMHDFVKVVDFGLAKCLNMEDTTQLTIEGTTTGTPAYMAPEVALGETRVDGRADVYALGCVAYFLLTGTMVFEHPNATTLALQHIQAVPDPPSQRTELAIPAELERIVLACLAKKPADRPASAGELGQMLAAVGGPAWTSEQADAWWERNLPLTSELRSFAQTPIATPAVVRKV